MAAAVGGLCWPGPGLFLLSPIHFTGCVVVLFHKLWEPFCLRNVLFKKESHDLDGVDSLVF